jgi:hypothetical protein
MIAVATVKSIESRVADRGTIEGSGFKPAVPSRLFSCDGAFWVAWWGHTAERGGVGKGLKKKKVEQRGSANFYRRWKRRRARARALPDAAAAKPGGADTTLQIIK